ncbi:MAG TPA: DUF3429 domain-containing protein [Rhodobiaceae bacterium]|nr:DUF3429 domain-containing protein [Rhodobiaceae bacterium]
MALWLGVGGLIPFLAPAVFIWMPPSQGWQGIAGTFGMVYGAIILSFLGGVRWGGALHHLDTRTFILSVLPALLAYGVLVFPALPLGPLLLAACHSVQGLSDISAAQNGMLPVWYARLRAGLTLGAVSSLLSITLNFYLAANI